MTYLTNIEPCFQALVHDLLSRATGEPGTFSYMMWAGTTRKTVAVLYALSL